MRIRPIVVAGVTALALVVAAPAIAAPNGHGNPGTSNSNSKGNGKGNPGTSNSTSNNNSKGNGKGNPGTSTSASSSNGKGNPGTSNSNNKGNGNPGTSNTNSNNGGNGNRGNSGPAASDVCSDLTIADASVIDYCASLTTDATVTATDLVTATADATTTSSYIVQFTNGSDRANEVRKAKGLGMKVNYVYDAVFSGMAVEANKGQLNALQKNPNVQLIEPDGIVTVDTAQTGATWGLDRIDQSALPLNSTFNYVKTGAGVTVYVIDTGILSTHSEFTGRVGAGFDAIGDGNGTTDCNGHGTHVSGTIGGSTYGVAKGVTLVPVRVLNCSGSGSTSGVIAGLNWAAGDHTTAKAVASMSLGGGASSSLDSAVNALISDGVPTVVAAGNSNADACRYSPARVPNAVTVGATTSSDARASYSNYGKCLDIFAPGSGITSSWIGSNSATNTISGTSMATPHVSGVVALALESGKSAADVVNSATLNKVTSPGRYSPNRLLFTNGL